MVFHNAYVRDNLADKLQERVRHHVALLKQKVRQNIPGLAYEDPAKYTGLDRELEYLGKRCPTIYWKSVNQMNKVLNRIEALRKGYENEWKRDEGETEGGLLISQASTQGFAGFGSLGLATIPIRGSQSQAARRQAMLQLLKDTFDETTSWVSEPYMGLLNAFANAAFEAMEEHCSEPVQKPSDASDASEELTEAMDDSKKEEGLNADKVWANLVPTGIRKGLIVKRLDLASSYTKPEFFKNMKRRLESGLEGYDSSVGLTEEDVEAAFWTMMLRGIAWDMSCYCYISERLIPSSIYRNLTKVSIPLIR